MPRLTTLIREIGTSGQMERFELSGDARADVGSAVTLEHDCQDSSCDIHAALDAGFPLSAAHLLIGATETPLLEAVISHYGLSFVDWPSDWDDWVTWHKEHGRQCPSCEAFNYDESDNVCGNCLADLA